MCVCVCLCVLVRVCVCAKNIILYACDFVFYGALVSIHKTMINNLSKKTGSTMNSTSYFQYTGTINSTVSAHVPNSTSNVIRKKDLP